MMAKGVRLGKDSEIRFTRAVQPSRTAKPDSNVGRMERIQKQIEKYILGEDTRLHSTISILVAELAERHAAGEHPQELWLDKEYPAWRRYISGRTAPIVYPDYYDAYYTVEEPAGPRAMAWADMRMYFDLRGEAWTHCIQRLHGNLPGGGYYTYLPGQVYGVRPDGAGRYRICRPMRREGNMSNRNAFDAFREASVLLVRGGEIVNKILNYYRDGCERFSYSLFELLGYVYGIAWPNYHYMFVRVDAVQIANGSCVDVVHGYDPAGDVVDFQEAMDRLIKKAASCADPEAAFRRWEDQECPVRIRDEVEHRN